MSDREKKFCMLKYVLKFIFHSDGSMDQEHLNKMVQKWQRDDDMEQISG